VSSEAAARGYSNAKANRRARARAAAKASARARRSRSFVRRRQLTRQQQAALAYPIQQLTKAQLRERFDAYQEAAGIIPSDRGFLTVWEVYAADMRAYRTKGQGFCTTNGQRAQSLCKAGRPRVGRTVRRAHRKLAELGVLRVHHDRRGGRRPGRKDRLRVELTQPFVPPPLAAPATTASPSSAGASPAVGRSDCAITDRRLADPAPPGSIRPPEGGSGGGRQAAEDGSNEEAEPPAALIARCGGDVEEARRFLRSIRRRR
jgi:hypothetical protein